MPDVVIVTGGSRGIGAATARTFAGRGWSVCIGYQQDQDAAAKVVADCEAVGVDAVAVMLDLAGGEVMPLFTAADDVGRLGALVNNAGSTAPPSRVDEMPADRVRLMFEVNVVAAFLCAGQAVRHMSTRHGGSGGCIVNVSSGAARIGSPGEYVDRVIGRIHGDLTRTGSPLGESTDAFAAAEPAGIPTPPLDRIVPIP